MVAGYIMSAGKNKNPAPLDILKIIIYNRHAKRKAMTKRVAMGKWHRESGLVRADADYLP